MNPHFPSDHGNGVAGGPFHRHKSIHKLLGGGKSMLLFSFWTINSHNLNHQSFSLGPCNHGLRCLPLAVADILLWKDRNLSAGVLIGATLIWYLFEVVEYNIIPLLCQIAILAMLLIFIWSNAAPLLDMYEFFSVAQNTLLMVHSNMAQAKQNSTDQFCIADPLQESQKSSSLSMPSGK